MKDTTNIRPLTEYISKITGKAPSFIKENLGIGELYDIRCKLIHDGKFPYDSKKMGKFFSKLEDIVVEVLRTMNGFDYNSKLEKYFNGNLMCNLK
jgi:hypothetical protein